MRLGPTHPAGVRAIRRGGEVMTRTIPVRDPAPGDVAVKVAVAAIGGRDRGLIFAGGPADDVTLGAGAART